MLVHEVDSAFSVAHATTLSHARPRGNKDLVNDTIDRPGIPPGRPIELPGRGTTFVREAPGPEGAPTLLLLHGWIATAALNWRAVFEPLGRCYRVVALDHRGHGRGVRSLRRFRLADCADDAAALLQALGIERAIAVGYSMGGPVAQLLWQRHRRRVAGLVLCATSRNFRGRSRAGIPELMVPAVVPGLALGSRLIPAAVRRRMLQDFLATRIRNPDALAWIRSEIGDLDLAAILEAGRDIRAFSSNEWIGSIDVPTAVVVTERDQLVSPAAQRKLAAAIPGATIHPVDGDHIACAYRPREFTAALLEACESVVARIAACG
jgi:3-oxoadipate enol-lactonase